MKKVCVFLVLCCTFVSFGETKKIKDIEFARINGQSLKLDLYIPEVKNPPLILWIHGGGWKAGSKKSCPLTFLNDHGFAVASISYRLTDKAIFPAQIQDCKGALRWLRANKKKYGYSTDKVGVAGSSAGGMLAALMGTSGDVKPLEGDTGGNTDQSSRVDAVIDFYGATDFILRSKTQPHRANKPGSVVHLLLGGGADKKIELAKQASAVTHVSKDDPPFLIFHGSKDNTVLIDQSEAIDKVYKAAGLPVNFQIIKGAGHGGKGFFTSKTKKMMAEFLAKYLKGS